MCKTHDHNVSNTRTAASKNKNMTAAAAATTTDTISFFFNWPIIPKVSHRTAFGDWWVRDIYRLDAFLLKHTEGMDIFKTQNKRNPEQTDQEMQF